MTTRNAYHPAAASYRNAAVLASPLTSVVMLYEGVIVELSRTIAAIQHKKLDEAVGHLEKAAVILRGLCHNLDFVRGGVLAERMRDTYVRLILSALHAFGKPDAVAHLTKIRLAVTTLRDAWIDVRVQQARAVAAAVK